MSAEWTFRWKIKIYRINWFEPNFLDLLHHILPTNKIIIDSSLYFFDLIVSSIVLLYSILTRVWFARYHQLPHFRSKNISQLHKSFSANNPVQSTPDCKAYKITLYFLNFTCKILYLGAVILLSESTWQDFTKAKSLTEIQDMFYKRYYLIRVSNFVTFPFYLWAPYTIIGD